MKKMHLPFIALTIRNSAKSRVIAMQGWLGLDNRRLINKPSTAGTNWL